MEPKEVKINSKRLGEWLATFYRAGKDNGSYLTQLQALTCVLQAETEEETKDFWEEAFKTMENKLNN